MPEPTRIAFSTSDGFVSKAIRCFTGSKVSHCFFVYWDEDFQRDMVMEATKGGFRIVPFAHYVDQVVEIITPAHDVDPGLKAAVDWLGTAYDYTGLIGMIFVEVGRWLKRKWKNPLQSAHAMFCSEVVLRSLQSANYPGADKLDPGSTDPQMLLDFLKS